MLVDIFETWFFGIFLCKLTPYLQVQLLPGVQVSKLCRFWFFAMHKALAHLETSFFEARAISLCYHQAPYEASELDLV